MEYNQEIVSLTYEISESKEVWRRVVRPYLNDY